MEVNCKLFELQLYVVDYLDLLFVYFWHLNFSSENTLAILFCSKGYIKIKTLCLSNRKDKKE